MWTVVENAKCCREERTRRCAADAEDQLAGRRLLRDVASDSRDLPRDGRLNDISSLRARPFPPSSSSAFALAAVVSAQQVGTNTAETHPSLSWQTCTASGCTTNQGSVVLDANWRWLHDSSGANCYDGNKWTDKCSTATDCATKCAVEGADYSGTYGATTSGNALSLKFVTQHAYGKNIGSRLYLMNSATKYEMFTLTGNELAFDVDLAQLECGLNGRIPRVRVQDLI